MIEVENGDFMSLVFGTNGAMESECARFHKILAAKLAVKRNETYSTMISKIRTKLSF